MLIDPARNHDVDKLTIISGFASASMLSQHRDELYEQCGVEPKIDLTIGMVPTDGLSSAQHNHFQHLQGKFRNKINCRYCVGGSSVHAKVYVWSLGDHPVVAYSGSANYTHSGFGREDRIEAMSEVDANSALTFCRKIHRQSRLCLFKSISNLVQFHDSRTLLRSGIDTPRAGNYVRLPLVDQKTGKTPLRSGLNWGQRSGRDPNQAYLAIPSRIYKTGFFPPTGERFVAQTDDGETMLFVRAQENGKALHTPDSNSVLGLYMRRRLKVPSGKFVTRSHLDRYGRTDVTVFRIDENTYFLDFST